MKLTKSFRILAMAAAASLVGACSEDSYWDAYKFEDTTYSFAQTSQNYSLTANDKLPELSVTLYRSNGEGEVTIPLDVQVNSDIISSEKSVTFAAGSTEARLKINVAEEEMTMGTSYKAVITLAVDSAANFVESNLSISGATSHTLSFIKDYNWVVAGSGIYASSWTGEQFAIQFEKAEGYTDPEGKRAGYYRIAPYKAGYYIPFYLDAEGNTVECPANSYATGIAGLNFYYDPASGYAQYCYFINEGNEYLLAGVWDSTDGMYIAQEQFLWSEGWPGAE